MFSQQFQPGDYRGYYPQNRQPDPGALDKAAALIIGFIERPLVARASRFSWVPERVAAHELEMQALTDDELRQSGLELGRQFRRNGFKKDSVARAFALVREVSDRVLGMRHYDVQLIAGAIMLEGQLAEMMTGEGKTLTVTLPAAVMALSGVPVHVITVNDYLAQRDADLMRPVYEALGLSVGVITQELDHAARQAAYSCDITYCTNSQVVFDYLKDQLVLAGRDSELQLQLESVTGRNTRVSKLLLRGLGYAIVDEADSVFIDEARTPLIISGETEGDELLKLSEQSLQFAQQLEEGRHYDLKRKERQVELRDEGKEFIRELAYPLGGFWRISKRRQQLISQALSAIYLFDRDEHYLVREGEVQIVDEHTGRIMPGRSWSEGMHQMIETKEELEVTNPRETLARISYQRFFQRYLHLSGMTGTAREVRGEIWSIYKLRVIEVPPYRPVQRVALPEIVVSSDAEKWQKVVEQVAAMHASGRPVLIGTRTVAASEQSSKYLHAAGLAHQVLNARQDEEEAKIVAEAGQPGRITVATNMAGRGTDIKLGEGVAELGGLHVILTERHEAGRIDRQLIGRSARQGDPGSFQHILSLEDSLLDREQGTVLGYTVKLMRQKKFSGAARVRAWLVGLAQLRIQRLHSRMREELLKSDEQQIKMLAFSGRSE